MDNFKLLGHIAKEIDKLRHDNAAFLAAGRAINFDEYRHVCGVIRGLNLAENLLNDLVQRMERADDDN
jgi:hypothetical protein